MKNQCPCPICKNTNVIPTVAFTYVEIYGGGFRKITCTHCGAPLNVVMERKVIIHKITIGDFEIDDWGNRCTPLKEIDYGNHKRIYDK